MLISTFKKNFWVSLGLTLALVGASAWAQTSGPFTILTFIPHDKVKESGTRGLFSGRAYGKLKGMMEREFRMQIVDTGSGVKLLIVNEKGEAQAEDVQMHFGRQGRAGLSPKSFIAKLGAKIMGFGGAVQYDFTKPDVIKLSLNIKTGDDKNTIRPNPMKAMELVKTNGVWKLTYAGEAISRTDVIVNGDHASIVEFERLGAASQNAANTQGSTKVTTRADSVRTDSSGVQLIATPPPVSPDTLGERSASRSGL